MEMGQHEPGQRGASAEQDQGQRQGQDSFNPLTSNGLDAHNYDADSSTSTDARSASASASAASTSRMTSAGVRDDYAAACEAKGAQLEPPARSPSSLPSPSWSPSLSSTMRTLRTNEPHHHPTTTPLPPAQTRRTPANPTTQKHHMQGWYCSSRWSYSQPWPTHS